MAYREFTIELVLSSLVFEEDTTLTYAEGPLHQPRSFKVSFLSIKENIVEAEEEEEVLLSLRSGRRYRLPDHYNLCPSFRLSSFYFFLVLIIYVIVRT